MAAPRAGEQSFQAEQPFADAQFDIFDWHPYFQSCVRYFVEHAQYNGPVQALAAFINIQLPFQRAQKQLLLARASADPVTAAGFAAAAAAAGHPRAMMGQTGPASFPFCQVSLQPYIRRLVVTGFDFPAVLHGFFGDDWELGIRPLHEHERRNYLFAAKSSSWLEVKRAYDMGADEAVPFLKPLSNASESEIVAAEAAWSEWLAMQDWMLGPRSLDARRVATPGGTEIKREEEEED